MSQSRGRHSTITRQRPKASGLRLSYAPLSSAVLCLFNQQSFLFPKLSTNVTEASRIRESFDIFFKKQIAASKKNDPFSPKSQLSPQRQIFPKKMFFPKNKFLRITHLFARKKHLFSSQNPPCLFRKTYIFFRKSRTCFFQKT